MISSSRMLGGSNSAEGGRLAGWWRGAPRVWAADVAIACVLCLLGFAVGGSYMRAFVQQGGVGDFGQPEFGAAVALACGRGFVNFGYAATPPYAKFLAREVDTFSCEDLPKEPAPFPLNFTQGLYRYLMSSAAAVWAIRGVSWSGLWPLFGAMFGSVITFAYGLFRSGSNRVLAVAASLALLVSSIHLGHLPYLRDYAKAPFMLGLLLLMTRMAAGSVTRRRMVGFGLAFGVVLGIGFGFRNDLLIHVPPFVAVVFLCLPGPIWSKMRDKSLAIGAAAVSFVLVASPILRAYSGGSNTAHVAVLGLTTPFDQSLGIRGTMYDWGYRYVDQYAADVVIDYGHRVHGRFVEYLSREYEQEAITYILQVIRQWPADMLTRVSASVVNVVQMPFTVGVWASSIPFGVTAGWASGMYAWQIWFLSRCLAGCGLILTVVALVVIAAHSIRLVAVLLALLVYYAGYPVIQFGARHFFHLEFIGWWALAFLLQQLLNVTRSVARNHASYHERPIVRAGVRRAAAFVAVAGVLVLGSMASLRAYQAPRVRTMLHGYLSAERVPLPTMISREAGGYALIVSPRLWELRDGESADMPVRSRYVVAEFSSSATCDALRLPITFRYSYEDKTSDFSRQMILALAPDGDPTRVFFPAYSDRHWSSAVGPSPTSFLGIELPRDHTSCLGGLYQIIDLHRYPLLLDLTLAPRWEAAPPFQTIATLERPYEDGTVFSTVPDDLVITRAMLRSSSAHLMDVSFRAGIVSRTPQGAWIARGRADGPDSKLLEFGAQSVTAGTILVAQGALRDGGISFRLFEAGRRVASVSVTRQGPFVVAMQAPAGEVRVEVANDITPWWPASRVGHRVGPLVAWIPGATLREDVTVEAIGWAAPPSESASSSPAPAKNRGER